jgi:hypothetical protein
MFGEGDDSDTTFRDVITLALCGFVAAVVLLLPHLNPKAKANATSDISSPGNVVVEIRWPDDFDTDVDLWVQAPGDVPVGYSNKGGVIFNLLRDDLGKFSDFTEMNYEVSFSRGVPAGEYTANLHLYRNAPAIYPVPVTVVVSVRGLANQTARQILTTKVNLEREGQETTVFRFALTRDGELVPGSVTSLFKPLRSGSKS